MSIIHMAVRYSDAIQTADRYSDHHLNSGQFLSGIQMAFEYRTIQRLDYFEPFKYRTSPLFRSPLYIENHRTKFYHMTKLRCAQIY